MDPQQLTAFKSHKTVHAGRIKHVGPVVRSPGFVGRRLGVEAADGFCYVVECPAEMFVRYFPLVDDFYVVYSAGTGDEYASISPAKQFEEGYSAIGDGSGAGIEGGEHGEHLRERTA